MATLWIIGIIVSAVLTLIVAAKFNLKRVPAMVLLNVLLPFAGLAYALYVVHVVIPRLVKAQTGQEVESPLLPYIIRFKAWARAKWDEIKNQYNKDDDKRL